MLLKPTQAVPHEGGLVFDQGEPLLRDDPQWIAEGVKLDLSTPCAVTSDRGPARQTRR